MIGRGRKKKEEERKRKVDIGGWDFGASPMIGILSIEKFIIYSTLSFSFYSNLIINLRISYIINKVSVSLENLDSI